MSHHNIYNCIENHLQENLSHYLELLRQMVSINSFSANARGVNALGKQTADMFSQLGFTAETVQSIHPIYGKHLILTKPGRSGRKIGLVSHLDTVFPKDEERRNNFTWRPQGERIYGPGTVDIKGGTLIIYMMMDALKTLLPDLYQEITWVVLLDAAEETDGSDFGELCKERLAGDTAACLVFEGGKMRGNRFRVVVARKGMAIYRIEVEGKASHAGSSHGNGASAIVQMADVIQRISQMTDYERGLTFNVGTVAGGTVINRVPHLATASVEMRAFSKEVYQDGIAAMLALNDHSSVSSANGDYACQVRVNVARKTAPWPRNEATDRLLAIWQEAAASLGYEVVPEERGGLSDGNYFWQEIPTIDGLGAAGGNAHCSQRSEDGRKDQEFCWVPAFVPKTMLNIAAVLKLLQYERVNC